MKSFALVAVSAVLMALSYPAKAQTAMLLDADGFCQHYLKTKVNPKPKDDARWLSQCVVTVQTQNACVRGSGWQSGQKSTEATERCWQTMHTTLRQIPVN